MKIEVSNGEILDKITILRLKLEHIYDKDKRANIIKEYDFLKEASEEINYSDNLYHELYLVNKALWKIEDEIRNKERSKEFDQEFIDLARSVYFTNDKRSEIKKQINLESKSEFVEEKSYKDYE
tara:strand:+ start:5390 stop:5761 length:372 start_codon:yes stop_codon:yes gene_type:complete